jgi:hypothetical protein
MKKMMMTMLNRLALACLVCASLILVHAQSLPRINREEDARPRELISEGLGVGRIYIGHSTADDVASVYGKTFETIEHGAQSFEMRYAPLGLSFYYCRADQQKRIFRIEARAPFNGFTARGIVPGKSKLRDVLAAYGQTAPSTTGDQRSLRYPGVEFTIPDKNADGKPISLSPSAKVAAINVVTSRNGSDCNATSLK